MFILAFSYHVQNIRSNMSEENMSMHEWVFFLLSHEQHQVASCSLVPKLTCSSSPTGEDWTPHTEWSPSLWPHSHIRKSSSYRNTAMRYRAHFTTSDSAYFTMLFRVLQSFWLWFWSILAFFWTLLSQLYWHSSLPTFFSRFSSSPPPFPLFSLTSLPGFATTPTPILSFTSHSPHSSAPHPPKGL